MPSDALPQEAGRMTDIKVSDGRPHFLEVCHATRFHNLQELVSRLDLATHQQPDGVVAFIRDHVAPAARRCPRKHI